MPQGGEGFPVNSTSIAPYIGSGGSCIQQATKGRHMHKWHLG